MCSSLDSRLVSNLSPLIRSCLHVPLLFPSVVLLFFPSPTCLLPSSLLPPLLPSLLPPSPPPSPPPSLPAAPEGKYSGIRDVFVELVRQPSHSSIFFTYSFFPSSLPPCLTLSLPVSLSLPPSLPPSLPASLSQMRTDGPTALFRGITPILLRAFPANAVSTPPPPPPTHTHTHTLLLSLSLSLRHVSWDLR